MEPGIIRNDFSPTVVFQQLGTMLFFVTVLLTIAAGVKNWRQLEKFQSDIAGNLELLAPVFRVLRWWTGSVWRIGVIIMISVCILGIGYGSRI